MSNIPSNTFDTLAARFFGPLAERAGLALRQVRDGIYEIAGQAFTVRIRRGTGHRKDFLVTLSPTRSGTEDFDDLRSEIGLGVLADYSERPLKPHPLDSLEDWQLAMGEAAEAARELCLPYLLGKQTDLEGVKQFIERRVEESGIRTKKYRFPRNVREEWI
jgi:hypothetical protein